MNRIVESDIFGFPNVQWLQLTAEVGKFLMLNFLSILCTTNHCNQLIFDSYSKIIKWTDFWDTVYKTAVKMDFDAAASTWMPSPPPSLL